ncbi:hypothetical protein, partial [Chimaeribacter coloradensis]|uniref:hypothetical protein n=1 Tax=Chimaeribacter coloradensis TaxID=2060068 RepID=UPI0019D44F75
RVRIPPSPPYSKAEGPDENRGLLLLYPVMGSQLSGVFDASAFPAYAAGKNSHSSEQNFRPVFSFIPSELP